MVVADGQTQTTKVIQKFRDWVLYSHQEANTKICFLSFWPRENNPASYKRGRSYFYISAWPHDGVKAEISVKLGKPLQNGSEVKVEIGGSRYTLFTKDSDAFVSDPRRKRQLFNAMKRASRMVVRATTADGTDIEDVYALFGVTAGMKQLSQGCNECAIASRLRIGMLHGRRYSRVCVPIDHRSPHS